MTPHIDTTRLAALADGELGGRDRRTVARHVADCANCRDIYESTLALRQRLRTEVPRYAAPAALRASVSRLAAPPPRAARWRWLATGALSGALATVLAWLVATPALELVRSHELVQQAVAAHVSATLGQRLITVASSDQHTVKPWMSARLPYSPPVPDLPDTGFVLVGGRLEQLDGAPTATLVYRYRQHMVDVYVRPLEGGASSSPVTTVRGFNVAHATGTGMEWIAVSDVSPDVLLPFVLRLAAGH